MFELEMTTQLAPMISGSVVLLVVSAVSLFAPLAVRKIAAMRTKSEAKTQHPMDVRTACAA